MLRIPTIGKATAAGKAWRGYVNGVESTKACFCHNSLKREHGVNERVIQTRACEHLCASVSLEAISRPLKHKTSRFLPG